MSKEQEIVFMDVRIFKMAQEKWQLDYKHCAEVFRDFDIYGFIRDMYEEFHVQGDEANLSEIETYLRQKGYAI